MAPRMITFTEQPFVNKNKKTQERRKRERETDRDGKRRSMRMVRRASRTSSRSPLPSTPLLASIVAFQLPVIVRQITTGATQISFPRDSPATCEEFRRRSQHGDGETGAPSLSLFFSLSRASRASSVRRATAFGSRKDTRRILVSVRTTIVSRDLIRFNEGEIEEGGGGERKREREARGVITAGEIPTMSSKLHGYGVHTGRVTAHIA